MTDPLLIPSKNNRVSSKERNVIVAQDWDKDFIKKDLHRLLKEKIAYKEQVKRHQAGRAANYVYIYDDYLKEKEYKSILTNIERRLEDFEIAGKIIKLTSFSNPRVIIEDEMRHGTGTVVIVGNEETLSRVFLRAADLETVFGFLPVGQKNNQLAETLGISVDEKACDILAARKIEKIDYGVINQKYFFVSNVYIPATALQFSCDDRFSIAAPREKMEVAVTNLLPPPFAANKFQPRPQDGKLEFYLHSASGGLMSYLGGNRKKGSVSLFTFKKLFLKSDKAVPVIVDGHTMQEGTLSIEVGKKRMALIVGKDRSF